MASDPRVHGEHCTVYGAGGKIVILVAGQHGNETTGMELARAMVHIHVQKFLLEHKQTFRLVVFQAVNNWGVIHGEHCDAQGRNPNGYWYTSNGGGGILPCAQELWRWLRDPECVGLFDLHSGPGYIGGGLFVQEGDEALATKMFPKMHHDVRSAEWLSRTLQGCARTLVPSFTIEASALEPLGRLPKLAYRAAEHLAHRVTT